MATAKTLKTRTGMSVAEKRITKPEDAALKALKVIPKRAGFRRAGYSFPDGETTIALDDLSDEQYEQLTTEPMLVTFLVDAAPVAQAD